MGAPNWSTWLDAGAFQTFGVMTNQLTDDTLITVTGKQGVCTGDDKVNPHPFGSTSNIITAPARILVWKLKGAV